MIREFIPRDIVFIEQIGLAISADYKFMINPYTKCYVYEEDNTIMGFILFTMMYEKVEIIDIAVKALFERKGLGTKLLLKVLELSQESNVESITLEVRASNIKAINFYKKHGFREITVRPSYYRDGEDALIMIKMVM